jgi:hypothetical protein
MNTTPFDELLGRNTENKNITIEYTFTEVAITKWITPYYNVLTHELLLLHL